MQAPEPIATAAPTPTSSPTIGQVVGCEPGPPQPFPIGLTARSTGARNLPSNIVERLPECDLRSRARPSGLCFDQVFDDVAVDGVDEDEPALAGGSSAE